MQDCKRIGLGRAESDIHLLVVLVLLTVEVLGKWVFIASNCVLKYVNWSFFGILMCRVIPDC